MSVEKLTLGTRGSKLAIIQTNLVIEALSKIDPTIQFNTSIITTKGDKIMSPIPSTIIGKAWFTAEIEQALQEGAIDIAIHSFKDLPPDLLKGLTVATILEREDPRDVLISQSGKDLEALPSGAIIGTDSIRRKALILHYRPDLIVKSIRGNVNTRLQKLEDEDYDAIVIAAAGIIRLGTTDIITQYLPVNVFIPAIGQGVLAAEIRQGQGEILALLRKIEHVPTNMAVQAEQAFSATIGGGCKSPVGCHVLVEDSQVIIHGMLGTLDAARAIIKSISGPKQKAVDMAVKLAVELQQELNS